MPDQPSSAPNDELNPEEAKMVIKAIEDVEKEEAEDQSPQSPPEE